MDFNSDFRYDLEFGQLDGENWFYEIVSGKKVEVKSDRLAEKTGNIYIEYESRGKPSGIMTTEADVWVYKFGEGKALIYELDILRRRLNKLVAENKARVGVKGGDNNTSLGILVKTKDLL